MSETRYCGIQKKSGSITSSRPGMTLVEMLVATTITLILVGAVAQLFSILGGSVAATRAVIETNDQLRAAAHKLRTDLAGITVDPIPSLRPEAANGYLEIIEGKSNDYASDYSSPLSTFPVNGDCDDALLFTTQSQGDAFVGRFNGSTIESPTAEVAWYCVVSGSAGGFPLYSVYRRQLLVTSIVGAGGFAADNSITGTLPEEYSTYDLSLRAEGINLYPNSLADLTKRENRFINRGTTFPHRFIASESGTSGLVFASTRQGEDLMLTNVVAFDVRVFDPYAEIKKTPDGMALSPGDPGYTSGSPFSPAAYGTYVDLGAGLGSSTLLGDMQRRSQWNWARSVGHVYDTWSLHYEFNGIDDDFDGRIDQGANGVDDAVPPSGSPDGIIDDIGERETLPPYPVALRGIEVRIRCYEPSSRQVRQVTVRHTFVPH